MYPRPSRALVSRDRVLHTLSENTVMFRLAARTFTARNLSVASRSVVVPRLACAARNRFAPCAAFSAAAGLSKEEITTRVLDVLKTFEKVDRSKVRSMYSELAENAVIMIIVTCP